MNARQAYLELLNGNKIRRPWYEDGVFLKMTEDGRVECSTSIEKLHTLIVADDYEIYTEPPVPKRKVRYAPVLFRGLNHVALSNVLYESKEKAKLDYGDSLICWLIDTPYAVELEE